jgi:adenine phosphoribosyltransferase
MDDPSWLLARVRDVPDFPEPGIVFKDLTPLLGDPEAFRFSVDALAEWCTTTLSDGPAGPVTKVVGVEARGFTFAAGVAYTLGAGLVPVRKPGKLPHETVSESYALEYGTDTLEVHRDAVAEGESVLVVDDVLATGGTAAATCRLLESVGGRVAGLAFVLELGFLDGRAKLPDYELFSLLTS